MNQQRICVITDTGTDTPADFCAKHDVRVVPLRVNYSDGSSYESGVDITTDEIVARFGQEVPKTSLPSPERIADAFAQAKADGYVAAVFVSISSGLSATCETARMVARTMENFPVAVVDTRSIGVAAGLVVMEAVRQIEAGVPFSSLPVMLEITAKSTSVFFAVRELSFLRAGGRISEAAYRLGSVLNIKPVFTCDEAQVPQGEAGHQLHRGLRGRLCRHGGKAAPPDSQRSRNRAKRHLTRAAGAHRP